MLEMIIGAVITVVSVLVGATIASSQRFNPNKKDPNE